jgi:large subunit ribosomal protein L29
MKIKQVRETPAEELDAQVKSAKRQILEMKIKKVTTEGTKQPLKRRTLRRDVARMLTVKRERELAAAKTVEK